MRGAIVKCIASAVLASAPVASLAACGGDDRIVRTGTGPARVQADGKLNADPIPLTLAEVAKQPKRSAQEAVLRLYFWGQWGGIANVLAAYDDSVRRALGVGTIADTFAYQRNALLGSRLRIAGATRTDLGTFVAVDTFTRYAPPLRESFLLRRRGGRWTILYDTLLERALAGHAHDLTIGGRPNPNRALLRRADLAAARATHAYSDALLSSSGARYLASFRRQAAAGRLFGYGRPPAG